MDGAIDKGILIVDDEEHIRTSLEIALRGDGHAKVYTARDGYECLRILEERGDEIYVVILDMRLPSSHNIKMNGDSILCNLTNSHKGIVGIIPLSAHFIEFPEEYIRSLSSDNICITSCIIKPYDTDYICSEVRSAIKLIEDKRYENSISFSNKSYQTLLSFEYSMETLKNEINCTQKEIQNISKDLSIYEKNIGIFVKEIECTKNFIRTVTKRQDRLENKLDILIEKINTLSQKQRGHLTQLGLAVWHTLLVSLIGLALYWGLDKFIIRLVNFSIDF